MQIKIFLLFLLLSINLFSFEYSEQKQIYYYTIEFPDNETWKLLDDSKKYFAYFENKSTDSFMEIHVYNLKNAKTNKELLEILTDRFNMTGQNSEVVFCRYNALRGEYEFNYNRNLYNIDIVVFKDNYYFYVIMGYSLKNSYEKHKNIIKNIINSFKIYYDNNVVYSNIDSVNKKIDIKEEKKEKQESNDIYYYHASWEKYITDFLFFKKDLTESKIELASIAGVKNNRWNGWDYYKINTATDPDYNFTFWKSFYQDMFNKNYRRIDNVYLYFLEKANSKKYSSFELAELVIEFIQSIPYERPKNVMSSSETKMLDFFTPNEIAEYKLGDCDSKSLFLIILLRRLGYDAVMLFSSTYSHAMVGLNINASGNFLNYNGKKYFFIETTYPNWKIGDISPEMKDLSKWYLIPIK